jgi:hypothetical protein
MSEQDYLLKITVMTNLRNLLFSSVKQADIALNDRIVLNDFKNGTLLLTIGYP